jgi:hypothetical protein
MNARKNTRDIISTFEKDSYKIIVSQDYGCPFHEYAVMYSFCVAAGEWPDSREKLNRIYPNTYQYFTWDNTIKYWGKDFNPDEIIESEKPVYLYLEKNNTELYQRTIAKFFEASNNYKVEKDLIFQNPVNGEGILRLYINKIEINELEPNNEEL